MAENLLEITQIDNEHTEKITNHLLNIIQLFNKRKFPLLSLFLNSNVIDYVSKLLYLTFSYINSKTIGEECMNFSSKYKSILYILLKSISNKLYAYILFYIFSKKIEKYILNRLSSSYSEVFKRNIQNFILSSITEDSIERLIEDMNLVFMFLYKYNDVIDIFFNMTYMNSHGSLSKTFYKSVAYMIILTKVVSFIEKIKFIYKILHNEEKTVVDSTKSKGLYIKLTKSICNYRYKHKVEVNSTYTCLLCLDKISIQKLTTTKCGHLFCWECICSYLQENPKCPKCRKEVYFNQIVLLNI